MAGRQPFKAMEDHSRRSLAAALEQCQAEIQSARRQLFEGHADICGLLLALSDWRAEERIIQ